MGGCQNYGPFLGTLNIRGHIIIGTPKGTIILTTNHIAFFGKDNDLHRTLSGVGCLFGRRLIFDYLKPLAREESSGSLTLIERPYTLNPKP